MIKPVGAMSDAGGGGGGSAFVSFLPVAGDYSGTSQSVTMTVTSPATKLRWKLDTGGYTTVGSTTANATVPLDYSGHTLYCDALDNGLNVLASGHAAYYRTVPEGGG